MNKGASLRDRAVVNGAASVSALRASVPSACCSTQGRWHRCIAHSWTAIDLPCPDCAAPLSLHEGRQQRILGGMDHKWRSLRSLGLERNTRHLIGPAQALVRAGRIESRLDQGRSCLVYRLTASAIEARRAGTEGSGAQHESAVPQADAQPPAGEP